MKPLFILPLLLLSGIVQGQTLSLPLPNPKLGGKLDTSVSIDTSIHIEQLQPANINNIDTPMYYPPKEYIPMDSTYIVPGTLHVNKLKFNNGIDTTLYIGSGHRIHFDSIYIQPFSVYISAQCKPTDTNYTTDGNTALQSIRYRFTQDKKDMQLVVTNYNDGSVWRFRRMEVGEWLGLTEKASCEGAWYPVNNPLIILNPNKSHK